MERNERLFSVPPLRQPVGVPLGVATHDHARVFASLRLALLRLLPLEVRRQHEIPEEPHIAELKLRLLPEVAQLPVGDALVRLADARA